MLSTNDTLSLTIEKPAAGGRMIARADGQVVLVTGAIPGEQAMVRITKIGKGVAYGDAVAIERPSGDRREPSADLSCGGCLYAHIAYERQIALKREVILDALSRIGRITWSVPIDVRPSPVDGYRMRARLHVRQGRLGFFREGTHSICDARGTRQLLPDTIDVLEQVVSILQAGSAEGDLEVELSENVEASGRAVHVTGQAPIHGDRLREAAARPGLTGLSAGQTGPASGFNQALTAGSPYVTDTLSIDGHDVSLRRHVLAFFQGNRYLLRDLVEHVVQRIEPGANVVDLYAGAGLFAIAAAMARGAHVTAIEGDRSGAEDLAVNAAQTNGQVAVRHEPVERFVGGRHVSPQAIIVDPPRTGMSRESIDGVIRLGAPRIVYVSCDVATLARDSRKIIDAGYQVARIDAFDLFPNTPHVETIVDFARS